MQKRRRLEQQCEQQQAEIKRLAAGMVQLRTDLQRINSLIAQNTSLKWVTGRLLQLVVAQLGPGTLSAPA
jgi:multidrug resistance efflux pump